MTTYSEPAIFNVLDPWYNTGSGYVGMVAGSTAAAATNTLVLQTIINLAQASCDQGNNYGAIILFPGNNIVPPPVGPGGTEDGAVYYLVAPGTGPPYAPAIEVYCNWPLRFLGTGNAKLTMVIANPHTTISGDMFSIKTSGGDNQGGMTFENLEFGYQNVSQTPVPDWAAIHCIPDLANPTKGGAENVRIVRCVFNDCPIGVWFESALEPSMLSCTTYYASNVGTGLRLGDGATLNDQSAAKKVYIAGCVFRADGGPKGSTAIDIRGCDHVSVSDVDIDSFLNGILIRPGPYGNNAIRCTFTACAINTGCDNSGVPGNAVLIQPQASAGMQPICVSQIIFTGCLLNLGNGAVPTADGTGILVDGMHGLIDTVRFVSCHSLLWPGPGLTVQSGSGNSVAKHIEVLGGLYSGNNTTSAGFTPSKPYGIYLNGAQGVHIVGAQCIGSYTNVQIAGQASSPTQAVGIYVDGSSSAVQINGCDVRNNSDVGIEVVNGSSDIIIDACDVTGSGNNGIKVDGTAVAVSGIFIRNCNASGIGTYSANINIGPVADVSNVQVTDCAGYNDQGPTLTGAGLPGSVTIGNNVCQYWGPIEFYAKSNTGTINNISVSGHNTNLQTGSFYLSPGQSGTISWIPTLGTIFLVIVGK